MLSGLATNALVRAYEATGLGTDISAPLRLRSYVVMIYTSGDNFWVIMNDTASVEVHNTLVQARTGAILWKSGDPGGDLNPSFSEAFMLPGIIAGEIIAAHRAASDVRFKPFDTGAYFTVFVPWPIGTYISFHQTREPTSVSINPKPNDVTLPGYLVLGYSVMANHDCVTISATVGGKTNYSC